MAIPAPARGARGAARVRSRDQLVKNLYQLLSRSYDRAEKRRKGNGLQVYRTGAPLLHQFFSQPWAQETIFPSEVDLARRFLAATRIPAQKPRFAVALALLANGWAPAWTNMLLKLPKRPFESLVAVAGRKHLEDALASGSGTLLIHSHTLFTQLLWRWLEHQSIDQGLTLWQWTWTRNRSDLKDPKITALEGARELHAATQSLKKGGLVHVLADGGRVGSKQVELPFFGRRRPFQPTFADLALATRANLVTADLTVKRDGTFQLDFGALEDAGTGGAGKPEADRIVRAYARHLAQRWTRHWSNLPWRQMVRFMKFPPAGKAPK